MSAEIFLDTNVLLYQLDARDARKHRIADRLIGDAVAHGTACLSFQVVQECLNAVLLKAEVGLDIDGANVWLANVLEPLCTVRPSIELYRRALALQARWKYGFYDTLVIAAALDAGCKRLLSEDMQHGQRIEGLRIENPFRGA